MKKIIATTVFFCVAIFLSGRPALSFKEDQKKNSRVKVAYAEKENAIKKLLSQHSIDISSLKIFIRVFKKEEIIEVWAKDKSKPAFSLLETYPICASSGDLGPKRKGGDGQVPEGFYTIETFNPWSNFYLSLKVSYPNQSDRILSSANYLGGDIFIHGNCVTIGCMPITDDKIKELYLLSVEAKNAGQSFIPVHIFPCKMNDTGMKYLEKKISGDKKLLSFWKNIQSGYNFFEDEKKIPKVSVEKNGSYSFKSE